MPPRSASSPGSLTNSTGSKPCPVSRSISSSGGTSSPRRIVTVSLPTVSGSGTSSEIASTLVTRIPANPSRRLAEGVGALDERERVGELLGVVRFVAGGGEEQDPVVRPQQLFEVGAEVVGALALGEQRDDRPAESASRRSASTKAGSEPTVPFSAERQCRAPATAASSRTWAKNGSAESRSRRSVRVTGRAHGSPGSVGIRAENRRSGPSVSGRRRRAIVPLAPGRPRGPRRPGSAGTSRRRTGAGGGRRRSRPRGLASSPGRRTTVTGPLTRLISAAARKRPSSSASIPSSCSNTRTVHPPEPHQSAPER